MAGVSHSLALIGAFEVLALDGIVMLKAGPISIKSSWKGLKIIGDLYSVIKEASQTLPELKDLDANEAAQLASAAYTAGYAIAKAAAGKE